MNKYKFNELVIKTYFRTRGGGKSGLLLSSHKLLLIHKADLSQLVSVCDHSDIPLTVEERYYSKLPKGSIIPKRVLDGLRKCLAHPYNLGRTYPGHHYPTKIK